MTKNVTIAKTTVTTHTCEDCIRNPTPEEREFELLKTLVILSLHKDLYGR